MLNIATPNGNRILNIENFRARILNIEFLSPENIEYCHSQRQVGNGILNIENFRARILNSELLRSRILNIDPSVLISICGGPMVVLAVYDGNWLVDTKLSPPAAAFH